MASFLGDSEWMNFYSIGHYPDIFGGFGNEWIVILEFVYGAQNAI
jgi:hypothetical protein